MAPKFQQERLVQGGQRPILQENDDEQRGGHGQPADGERAPFQKRSDFGDY